MCYKELDKHFAVVHRKKITKKARVEAAILNSLTPISKAIFLKILLKPLDSLYQSILFSPIF